MKVLVVVDSLRLGGAESVLGTLARAAPAAGFTVEVACLAPAIGPTASMVPVLAAAGVHTRFLDVPRLLHPGGVPAVLRAIRSSGCDVVHAHLEYAAVLAAAAGAVARRPVLTSFHQLAAPLPAREAVKERLAIAAAGRGRAVVFVSRASLESYAARYRRRRNWTVVPNGVDLEVFRPGAEPLPAELGVPAGAPVVALVAALRPGKGHRLAFTAWADVVRRVPDARLLLVGSGEEEPALRRRATELGVAGRVVFAGLRSDVARLLRGVQAVLLPSESEALPTVLLEAAAAGRPAVATAVGGVPEVVVDGSTGLLVPAAPGALAAALVRLLTDSAARHEMGTAARRRAEAEFGMRQWAARLASYYAAG